MPPTNARSDESRCTSNGRSPAGTADAKVGAFGDAWRQVTHPLDLNRRVYGMATLGEICEIYPTRGDREEYLGRLQGSIDDFVSRPSTADTEKHPRGLRKLHACVSDLLISANGWPDKSCSGDGG